MKISYVCDTDFLVVGAGGAGIKAAIKAGEAGAKVLLVSKYKLGHTGSTFYPRLHIWGMNAVTREDLGDSEENFLQEILDAGDGAADYELAKTLAYGVTPVFRELEREYGLEFSKGADGNYLSVIPCFGRIERGAKTSMADFKQAMWKRLMAAHVQVRSGIDVITLAMHDGKCCGALCFDEHGELAFFRAKAVFLGTGGGCGIFKYGLATPDQTGDGYIMALDAGASLVNMEFIQFIPGITWPVEKFLFQEKALDTMPELKNRLGQDFLLPYLPEDVTREACLVERAKHGPFSTKGEGRYFDIAMYEGWRKGETFDSGGMLLRYDKKVREDKRPFIQFLLEWLDQYKIDGTGKGFHLIPHAQGFNGGIHIDVNAGAGVPGLYAAGETAGGPHGADRLGGNALAASQVFGGIAGEKAAEYIKGVNLADVPESELLEQLHARFDNPAGGLVDMQAGMREIKEIMWYDGAIVRSGDRCREGLDRIAQLEAAFNPLEHFEKGVGPRAALGLRSFYQLAEVLLTAMDFRRESRGPHYRLDYPESDPQFRGYASVKKKDGVLGVTLTATDKGE